MKILIADNHVVIREGVKQWLKNHTIIEAIDADETVKLYRKYKPDVVIIESRLPGDDVNCLSKPKEASADAQVVIFSGDDNPTYIARAFALGARGYLSKSMASNDFLASIKAVAAGSDLWTREMLKSKIADEPRLTKRENEVLKQLAVGLNNREIGKALGISYETVEEHVQHILEKLDVGDRTQAAMFAVKKRSVASNLSVRTPTVVTSPNVPTAGYRLNCTDDF
jgi:DNA-binding NarL/FixJ family response regulator